MQATGTYPGQGGKSKGLPPFVFCFAEGSAGVPLLGAGRRFARRRLALAESSKAPCILVEFAGFFAPDVSLLVVSWFTGWNLSGTVTVNLDLPPDLKLLLKSRLASSDATLARIEQKLDAANTGIKLMIENETLLLEALKKVDAATTAIGASQAAIATNIGALSTTADTISTEVDALVVALQAAGVSQAVIDQATALGVKADALVTAADATQKATEALVPVLNGIASKAQNPVPVPIPNPPPPVVIP